MSRGSSHIIEALYWPQLAIVVQGEFLLELAHSFGVGRVLVDVDDTRHIAMQFRSSIPRTRWPAPDRFGT